jgi:glucokinase
VFFLENCFGAPAWCATNGIDILGRRGLELPSANSLLAYDIGGSHITAGLCLLEPLTLVKMAVAPLPDTTSSEAFVAILHTLGQHLIGSVELAAGACLAFPGPFAYDLGISHMRHKLRSLYGVELRPAIADRLGWMPEQIRFMNDADAALLGDVAAGAAKGANRAVGITLGTGIGFASIRNGNLNDPAQRLPPDSEIWNLPFMNGIVEDLLSSRAIERDYEDRTAKNEPVATIALGAADDPTARAVFDTFGRYLGQVVNEILAPLDPEIVVFGGGISRSSHLFLPAARSQMKASGIRLVPSALMEKAPLLGAAAFWQSHRKGAELSALSHAK